MIKRLAALSVILGALLARPTHAADAPCEPPDLTYTVECVTVTVPQNDDPDPLMLSVEAMRITRRGATLSAPPLLYLEGGPGVPTLDRMPQLVNQYADLLNDRALVLVDMRGIGRSTPSLSCSGDHIIAACRDDLLAQGIDLRAYSSVHIAHDLEAVRIALGIEEWDVLGVSYGARHALTTMRLYPGSVRAAILDSPAPPEVDLFAPPPAPAAAWIDYTLTQCEADFACRTAYPDLHARYEALVSELNAAPLDVELGGQPVTITGDLITQMVLNLSQGSPLAGNVPALLTAVEAGDLQALEDYVNLVGVMQARGLGSVMGSLVLCNEEAPFADPQRIAQAVEDAHPAMRPRIADFARFQMQCTEVWGLGTPDPIEAEPVTTEHPTLVVSGSFDVNTPPAYAESVAAHLPNAALFRVEGGAHGLTGTYPCAQQAVRHFLAGWQTFDETGCTVDVTPTLLITASTTRALGLWLASALGLVGVGLMMAFTLDSARMRDRVAWAMALQRAGWWLPAGSAAIVLVVTVVRALDGGHVATVVETVVPLAFALHVTMLLIPGSEPALEVQIAAPRPARWLALERLLVTFGMHAAVAVGGTLLAGALQPETPVLLGLVRWIPPALFLGGTGFVLTVRTGEVALGAIFTGLYWGIWLALHDVLLPPQIGEPALLFPFNLIAPFTWMIHVSLQPEDLGAPYYLINRMLLASLGLALIAVALHRLAQSERVLNT